MPSYAYLPLLALAISLANFWLGVRSGKVPGARYFLGIVGITALYSFGHWLELLSTDIDGALFWDNVQFLATDLAPVAAFLLALSYCCPDLRSERILPLLLVVPALNFGVVWFGPADWIRLHERVLPDQNLFYLAYDYGWWMWVTIAHAYALMLCAVLALVYRLLFAGHLSRRQIAILLIGMLVPWAGTILTITGSVPFAYAGLDITPITLTFANVIFSVGLYRFRLLDIVPVARERVFEVITDGVLVLSHPGEELVDWNPAARKMLEPFARVRWVSGVRLDELLPQLAQIPGAGDVDLYDNDDTSRPPVTMFVRRNRIESGGGIIRGHMLTVQDVSELRLARRDLEAARVRAEEANMAKSRLLANVSHEIRTPMNAILGVAELLNDSPLDEDQRGLLRVFRTAGKTLLHMLNDLLDISSIEVGRIELQNKAFELPNLLSDIRSTFQINAAEKNLKLGLEMERDLPERIVSDPQRLTQVLTNLISNAIKHTEEGGIVVRARAVRRDRSPDDGGLELEFVVEDTGIGLPTEPSDRLFEPFFQGSRPGAAPPEGAGLGLSIARQLVKLMGGTIRAENRAGSGACFSFTIRAREITDPSKAARSGSGRGTTTEGPDFRGLRLLVAEDLDANRFLIERFLQKSGIEITFAHDGREACAIFQKGEFDLVLMDVQMPLMDGYESTRCLRRFEQETGRPRTPIVALTAYALEEERQHAIASGMDDHLTKPIDRAALIDRIDTFTKRHYD